MFDKQFYSNNRKQLSKKLPGHALVIAANAQLQKSADIAYGFRQDRNFLYLTGLPIADAWLVIDPDGESTLLLQPQNDYQAEWDGGLDHQRIKEISGIKTIAPKTELPKIVKNLARAKKFTIGYVPPAGEGVFGRIEPYGFFANPARKLLQDELFICGISKDAMVDIRMDIARLRQLKQEPEIAAIRKAISVTEAAIHHTRQNLGSFKTEKDIERYLSSQFYLHADGHGFDPIVAAGSNAATIHYNDNDAQLAGKNVLLMDIGAEWRGYSADISRTYQLQPPTELEQSLFELVYDVHAQTLELYRPGSTMKEIQAFAEAAMQKGLKQLKLSVDGDRAIPHGVGHYLGLDVHDAGDYTRPLEPNTVLTLEPGVYIPDKGVGIRIEDDVLITETGHEILSDGTTRTLI